MAWAFPASRATSSSRVKGITAAPADPLAASSTKATLEVTLICDGKRKAPESTRGSPVAGNVNVRVITSPGNDPTNRAPAAGFVRPSTTAATFTVAEMSRDPGRS